MINEIRIEELHPTYQQIAKIIGLENALKLGQEIGGEQFYLPRLDSLAGPLVKVKHRKIIEELKQPGASVAIVARKYRLTQRQIYVIKNRAKSQAASENG